MSLIKSTGYLVKDIKDEAISKIGNIINTPQSFFVVGYLILLSMFSIYTYIIVKTKNTLIIIVSMIILFTYAAYQCHFTYRMMKLCDDTLRKWRKTINLTEEVVKEYKEVVNGLYNIRRRHHKRLQKKKH